MALPCPWCLRSRLANKSARLTARPEPAVFCPRYEPSARPAGEGLRAARGRYEANTRAMAAWSLQATRYGTKLQTVWRFRRTCVITRPQLHTADVQRADLRQLLIVSGRKWQASPQQLAPVLRLNAPVTLACETRVANCFGAHRSVERFPRTRGQAVLNYRTRRITTF
jgi:hypothetical protein